MHMACWSPLRMTQHEQRTKKQDMSTKHKRKRIKAGVYEYRGFSIKRFNLSYLMDSELRGVQWDVYENGKQVEIADTLSDAVRLVDSFLR